MSIFKKLFGNSQNDMKEVITMTNTQKALELINTFATGDIEKAASLLAEGIHSAQPCLRHRKRRICRLGGLPCVCSGKNHGKQYPRF